MARKNEDTIFRRTKVSVGELVLLLVGIFVGWLVGQGFTAFLLAVPIALFIGWAYEYIEGKI